MTYPLPSWQQQLAAGFSDIKALCDYLEIPEHSLPPVYRDRTFPMRVPRGFADCMQRGDPNDPLLRQVLPLHSETLAYPGYSTDPVGDLPALAAAGIIHKYHGRVLLILTGACAIHCRYCFRRHFPYAEHQLSSQNLLQAIGYIQSRHEISEVILSGGDPLLLSDEKLQTWLQQLGDISHLRRIRIHTRLPVVLPARITPGLLQAINASGKQTIMVIHANHGNELSEQVGQACRKIIAAGLTILNQSVLLQGVNADGETLCRLSERLIEFGVLPYYLHMLDTADGTAHFAVDEQSALDFIRYLRRNLPGYLVPKLVREQPGEAQKSHIL
jgi:L-lysine 2,3-aminomutase